jgi:hypothetical protein
MRRKKVKLERGSCRADRTLQLPNSRFLAKSAETLLPVLYASEGRVILLVLEI